MEYIEKFILLKNKNRLTKDIIAEFAKYNHKSITQYTNDLYHDVYDLSRLTADSKEYLRFHIHNMSEDEINTLEHVNHLPIREILNRLSIKKGGKNLCQ